jgi:hypothetical protein
MLAMLQNLLLASSLLLLTTTAAAQCSLAVTGSGAPGTALTFAIDGTGSGFAFLAIGETQGTTTIPLGSLGTLTLGLDLPFVPLPIGFLDAQGDRSLAVNIPAGVTSGLDLFAQGVTLGISFGGPGMLTLDLCATNVAAFHVGT